MPNVIVIGASSTIAQAFIRQHLEESSTSAQVYAISQHPLANGQPLEPISQPVRWVQARYDDNSIKGCCESLSEAISDAEQIVIFNGMLHGEGKQPEKSISQLDSTNILDVLTTNALTPLLWLKHLKPIVFHQQKTKIAILSARVGSIADNQLGGWYSYRASKAALNMLVKCYAIELGRSHPYISMLLYHPGTTDTPLSKPFQGNVPEQQLFTPDKSARYLMQVLEGLSFGSEVQYLDWKGEPIDW